MKSLHGIPFRLAVEAKRYRKDRTIGVELVRSFVGSNHEHQANKLVYVTTSGYSADARTFASRCQPQLIELKRFDQVLEWCDEAQRAGEHLG